MSATILLFLSLLRLSDHSLNLRFIGNAAFEITDGRTTILTDYPYQSGAFGYMTYNPDFVRAHGNVILLISHRHADHFDSSLASRGSWRIIGPHEVTRAFVHRGYSTPIDEDCCGEKMCALSPVINLDSVITVEGIRIFPIATSHGATEHYSYRLEWAGLRLFLAGDTDDPMPLLKERNLDYAFVTPWLWKAMRADSLSIPAGEVIVYHRKKGEHVADCSSCWVPEQGDQRTIR